MTDLERVLTQIGRGVECLALELPSAVYDAATPQLFRLITAVRAAAARQANKHFGWCGSSRYPGIGTCSCGWAEIDAALRALTDSNNPSGSESS